MNGRGGNVWLAIIPVTLQSLIRETIPSPRFPGVHPGPGEERIRAHNVMLTIYGSKGSLGNKVRYSRCLSPERTANFTRVSTIGSAVS